MYVFYLVAKQLVFNSDFSVPFSFLPKGGGRQNEMCELLRGGQVRTCICVQSMWQNWGVRGYAPLGKFYFGPFIRRNLVESGTVFTQT